MPAAGKPVNSLSSAAAIALLAASVFYFYQYALRSAPSVMLPQLGDMFVNLAHDWNKGWAVADQLIRERPRNPYGWMLRATIQQQQPRPGLDATADQLQAQFGQDPRIAKIVVRMRAAVALRKHAGIDARASAP